MPLTFLDIGGSSLLLSPLMNVWWCNQTASWAIERAESVICGSRDTVRLPTYRKTVGRIRPGDFILHYNSRARAIVAVSLAKSQGRFYEQLPLVGQEDRGAGWRVEAEYFVFNPVIPKKKFVAGSLEILKRDSPKNFPLAKDGDVMQGYCFPFTQEGLQVVRDSFNTVWPAWVPEFARTEPSVQRERSTQRRSRNFKVPKGEFTQAEFARANGLPERGVVWSKLAKLVSSGVLTKTKRSLGKGRPAAIYTLSPGHAESCLNSTKSG